MRWSSWWTRMGMVRSTTVLCDDGRSALLRPATALAILDTGWDEAERWLESLTSGQWQIINIIFLLQNLIKIKRKVGIFTAHTVKIRLIRCSNTRFKCFCFNLLFYMFRLLHWQLLHAWQRRWPRDQQMGAGSTTKFVVFLSNLGRILTNLWRWS